MNEGPDWARRLARERKARNWSKPEFIAALRRHAPFELPEQTAMLQLLDAWEVGLSSPSASYQPVIAETLGTVTGAIWPPVSARDGKTGLAATTVPDTFEIAARLRSSSIDDTTIEGLRITVDRICGEYAHVPASQLLVKGGKWLRRMRTLLDGQMPVRHRREILSPDRVAGRTGWLRPL